MKRFYKILRTVLVLMLVLPLAVPALLYIILSLPGVQTSLGHKAEKELTSLLGTEVSIGRVDYSPFTRIVLRDVSVNDYTGHEALHVGHLGAGISIGETLWNKRLVITYAEIIDLQLSLWRDSVGAPLNIDPILARFKKKDKKEKSPFDLAVNMVVIRRSGLTYDVHSEPAREDGAFDPSHIRIYGLRTDLRAPRISNEEIYVAVKRMAATEQSGFTLSSLTAALHMDMSTASLSDLTIQLPSSSIAFDNIDIQGSPLLPDFDFKSVYTALRLLPDSHVATSDLTPFIPSLNGLGLIADIELESTGDVSHIDISRLGISLRDRNTWIILNGSISNYIRNHDSIDIEIERITANFNIPETLRAFGRINEKTSILAHKLQPLASLGDINILGQMFTTSRSIDFNGSIVTSCGSIDIDAGVMRSNLESPLIVKGSIATMDLNPSGLDEKFSRLTGITLKSSADLSISKSGAINGNINLSIDEAILNGITYSNIAGNATFAGRHVDMAIDSNTPLADFSIRGGFDRGGADPLSEMYANIRNLSLSPLVNKGMFKDYTLQADIDASLHGLKADELDGWINIKDLHLYNTAGDERDLELPQILLTAHASDSLHTLSLTGGPIDMKINGEFSYPGLIHDIKMLTSTVFPALVSNPYSNSISTSTKYRKRRTPVDNNKSFGMTSRAVMHLMINPDTMISRFFRLPVEVIYPLQIEAIADKRDNTAVLMLNAPYLKQKDKLIEETTLTARIDGNDSTCLMGFSSLIPTKNGQMDLNIKANGVNNIINTDIHWRIDRKSDFHGDISLSSTFGRNDENQLLADIRVAPGILVFNDSVWNVSQADINVKPDQILVSNLGATRSGQILAINGIATADSLSRVEIALDHIDLDYVFETLALSDAVKFGGIASGRIFGEALLSKDPILYTPRLIVENMSYNNCNFGTGDIHSWWDNNTKTITIGAELKQLNGKYSKVAGTIKPLSEELDFTFTADDAPADFMLPFMSAFTSSVTGAVSGKARLYGTFKDLDLTGDIYAKNLKMKLDFTNTSYTVSDSVHISPGVITFNNVILTDRDGNRAKLSGEVTHRYFHDPSFKFYITEAQNMLVYNVGEHDTEDPWYGRIYGTGSATVTGVPGKIDIGVKMRTAPKSTFTYVLSDAEQSVEYDFIRLRDHDRAKKDSIEALDSTPPIVKQLRQRIKQQEEGAPTVYSMEFVVDITPEATLNLIMDPIGGDKITAHGTGHLRMNYASDGELEMYGEYTLNKGSYNFTLQDIIIKDFTILEGSKITFLGDPYAAQLNIRASYSLNANLSDLDESFLEDRELTRTNVKVNAIMIVTGDMRQPDIKFDLEFPTLTADTYRKVRSIISTDEMMSRQIIYLLALNRFYTPEYMATTHGNELVSVASSTLSSRLGSMLGQLSDNWSIAPAIRSDRGDFSDVEVDVALSSQLLDNRLLFNGNLGYRDKSLNNNSFIGDFDIRYLLNRAGTIQLKAYNRYNDQNYYLKSALTTQGVGVVFKRDFDNIFSFLRPLKRKFQKKKEEENPDSVNVKVNVELNEAVKEESEDEFITIRPVSNQVSNNED